MKTRFFAIFSSFFHQFSLKLHTMRAYSNVKHLIAVKSTKKIFGPKFGPKGAKSGLKIGFFHFLKFGSLVFLEIAYNDNLEQCLTTSRGKTSQKFSGAHLWPNRQKSGPKLVFLPFSQVWLISFPLNCMG